MLSALNNISSLIAQRSLRANQNQLNLSLERLSTGLRINHASDDPAGLIASENLRSEKAGLTAAISNASRAGNVLATAEGGLNEVSALLNQLKGLVGQSANVGGLSGEEIAANQLQADTILQTIDRLSGATTFAGQSLLNGNLDYSTSGINTASIGDVHVNAAQRPPNAAMNVSVHVVASARTAQLTYTGGAVGTGGLTIEVAGNAGSTQLSFSAGTTVSSIATAIIATRAATGLSATVNGGNLEIHSTGYGSKSFASVRAISGAFTGGTGKAAGRDAQVTVNGTAATADGLHVTSRTALLDVSFDLASAANTANASTSFNITGGGATFLIGPRVEASQFTSLGIGAVNTASLGDGTLGMLASLRSGGVNALSSGSLIAADKIVDAAISQVSTTRGRIGATLKYTIDSTINAMQVQYENISAAESAIRDTDFAEETSRLTRAQILTQAATTVLAQANSQPQLILTLLRGIG